jgi:hypothetical protein
MSMSRTNDCTMIALWMITIVTGATLITPMAEARTALPIFAAISNGEDGTRQTQPPDSASQPNLPVSPEQALFLIRSALLTLHDANRSGNYTVLRDLAAPGFQVNNSAADLGQAFADVRRRNVDLSAVALAVPQLIAPPALDDKGMLRLTGHFHGPLQIDFDLLFENISGQWRLFGIAVGTGSDKGRRDPPH